MRPNRCTHGNDQTSLGVSQKVGIISGFELTRLHSGCDVGVIAVEARGKVRGVLAPA